MWRHRGSLPRAGASPEVKAFRNPRARRATYPDQLRSILSLEAQREARSVIERWPGYAPTPLLELPRTAEQLGLGRLWLKDEGARFGLGAFKSMGGAYAVYRLLAEHIRAQQPQADVSSQALIAGTHRELTSQVTVACASAGNHGRAVAWGAQLFGARCIVYLYQGVSAERRAAIEKLGATVDTSSPNYDEAVRRVARTAQQKRWHVVSDTAYPGYLDIPRTVMQGYTLIAQEALEQLGDERPTHVILQVGVGGFAAAIAAHLWETLGADRPTIITVEPSGAACLLESLVAQQPTTLRNVSSIMGGLCCGEVSLLAWEVLQHAVDWAVAIPDDLTIAAMQRLAQPLDGEPRIIAGESGAAGFAALMAMQNRAGDDPLGPSPSRPEVDVPLGPSPSRPEVDVPLGLSAPRPEVLLFISEGAADPAAWMRYTGSVLEAV